jgi:hypothetical protein
VAPELSNSNIVNRAALTEQGRVVQRAVHVIALSNPNPKRLISPQQDEASMTLDIGWLVVLIGVAAMQWADGRFPFARAEAQHPSRVRS